jgi:hypothetical protein
VRPRRHERALLCGPSTSPLEVTTKPRRCLMLSTPDLMPNTLGRALVLSHARPAIPLIAGLVFLMPVRCLADGLPGCYELKLSKWIPAIPLGADEKFVTPPKRIALTETIDSSWGDQHAFKVLPTGGASPSVHRHAYWTSDAHQVHVVFSTGYSGLTMDLEPQGSNLVGTAYTAWDFPRTGQTSHVVATRISCEPKK